MILNMLEGKPLPVYGDGKNIRDWLYVGDHNAAVWLIMKKSKSGECYNIGGENECENICVLNKLIEIVAAKTRKKVTKLRSLISYVIDRPGHDRRYAMNCDKIKNSLGWRQSVSFGEGLQATVDWYLANPAWVERVRSGEYIKWIDANYGARS
jgi:dTDP-glucose 4,6-dehydratase